MKIPGTKALNNKINFLQPTGFKKTDLGDGKPTYFPSNKSGLVYTLISSNTINTLYNIINILCFYWTPIFKRKGVLWFHHCQYVSMSVGKRIFSKTAHRIFLKLLMKLGCLKGKKLTEPDFWGNLILGIRPVNNPKIWFFGFCKKNSPFICIVFEFKSCTIMTFMIVLKLHIWAKSGSGVKCKNALSLPDCRIFKL